MALERQPSKPEIAAQKRTVKLAPAIGDWTTYKPPKVLVKKVKTGLYGFDRLSKEELNAMLFIHYRFTQEMLKHFKIDLGMAVELFTVSAEQTTYLNFLRGLTGPIVQCRISIPGFHDPILLLLDMPLANSIINYSLGSFDLEPINRSLTEAEKTTLGTTLNEYLPGLSKSFGELISDLSLEIISSPDVAMDPTISPSSTLASFIAEVSLADNPPGRLYIAYAGTALRNLLARYDQMEKSKGLDFSRLPGRLLSQITAPVLVELGETFLTTNEIGQFEVGDVVSLENSINSPSLTTIGNLLKLSGQPGSKHQKAAVRIVGLQEAMDIELPPPELAAEKPAKEPPPPPPAKPTTPPPAPKAAPPPPKAAPAPPPADLLEEEEDWLSDEEFSEEDIFGENEDLPKEGKEGI